MTKQSLVYQCNVKVGDLSTKNPPKIHVCLSPCSSTGATGFVGALTRRAISARYCQITTAVVLCQLFDALFLKVQFQTKQCLRFYFSVRGKTSWHHLPVVDGSIIIPCVSPSTLTTCIHARLRAILFVSTLVSTKALHHVR